MKNQILLLKAVLLSLISAAQGVSTPTAAAYLQQDVYSNVSTSVFSFTGNSAALAKEKRLSFGLYSEKKFLLQELSHFSAALILPSTSGNFGLSTAYYGNADYNETTIGLAYAKRLATKTDVGVQFNYFNGKTRGYGNRAAIIAEGGVIFHFTDAFSGGVHLRHAAPVTGNKAQVEKMPTSFRTGFGYTASDHLFISTDIVKEENSPLNVNAGLLYKFDEKLFVKGGISSGTAVYYFGIGTMLKQFRLDVLAAVHPYLGITPGLMLNFKPLYEEE